MQKAEQGKILIAMPNLDDPSFIRSVILLCEHTNSGSFGLVLNQASDNFLAEVLDEINDEFALYLGGPVEQNTLHYIHRLGNIIEDSIDLGNGLYWSGNFEEIKKLINLKVVNQDNIRFFIGYSGWAPGQLEAEIDEKVWLVATTEATQVFEKNIDKFWRYTLINLGSKFKHIANYPIDPRLN